MSRAAGTPQQVPAQKTRLARNNFEPASVAIPNQISAGNNRDTDNGYDNNDARHNGSTAGNRIDSKV